MGVGARWGWERQSIVNGYAFHSGQTTLTLKLFLDENMDQTVLFSQQTRRNIRENYEETYLVDDDHVYFTSLEISGRSALVVSFADRSSGKVIHRRQYYVVDGLSSRELDERASLFKVR